MIYWRNCAAICNAQHRCVTALDPGMPLHIFATSKADGFLNRRVQSPYGMLMA